MKSNFTLVFQLLNARIYIDINSAFLINLITILWNPQDLFPAGISSELSLGKTNHTISFKNKGIYYTSTQELTLFTRDNILTIFPFFDSIFFFYYYLTYFTISSAHG